MIHEWCYHFDILFLKMLSLYDTLWLRQFHCNHVKLINNHLVAMGYGPVVYHGYWLDLWQLLCEEETPWDDFLYWWYFVWGKYPSGHIATRGLLLCSSFCDSPMWTLPSGAETEYLEELGQYHGCCWPCDTRRQGIDPVEWTFWFPIIFRVPALAVATLRNVY